MQTINDKKGINIKELVPTLVVGITLLCLVIVVKNQYSSVLLKNANYGMPALIEKGNIDNLYLGSSMFRQGLSIDVLNDNNSAESHYILSYNGNQPVAEYVELKYLLDNNVKIKNLYVDMYLDSVTAEPDISDEKLFLETDIRTKVELFNTLPNKTFNDFWNMFVTSNNDQLLTWPVTYALVNKQFLDGGTRIQNEGLSEKDYIKLKVPIVPDKLNSNQIEYLNKLIILCRTNDVNLVFIETPKAKCVLEDEAYKSLMKEYGRYLVEYGVSCIRYGEDYTFDLKDSKLFLDAVHLSSQGRDVFTRLFCDIAGNMV